MIHLEDITEVNWRIPLSVSKEQEAFVSNPMKLLARAYAFRNSDRCMRALDLGIQAKQMKTK